MIRRLVVTAAVVAAAIVTPSIGADAASCDTQTNNTYKKLLDCVTLEGVREHQAALQAIADANNGNRSAGTSGYEQSADYVIEALTAAGWSVEVDEFPFTYVGPAVLQQTAPVSAAYETGSFTGTGYGSVAANVQAVDLSLAAPAASTSGCEAADFAGFAVGNIALVQRGTCTFAIKALNAQAAGASGVIVFNQGTAGREGLIIGTLAPSVASIPVVGASFADGAALAQPGSAASISVPPPEQRPQRNIIAELPGTNADNVVMAGAHLDSVQRGPGINDNGSGSAALLELAEQMSKVKPVNTVRLAWWGAEESGLLGSTAYVNGLPASELDRIALYLNFDMIGSPNHVFFVYDGDDSDGVGFGPGPFGSAQIEKTFEEFYAARGESWKGTDFSGRSDYGPFIAVGIPSGGLFTGAEGIKTAAEAAIWGGTAGEQYDPCYHLACDTFANNNEHALDVNSDAVAYATLKYAMSTKEINGINGHSAGNAFPGTTSSGKGYPGTGAQGGLHDHDEDSHLDTE